MTGESVSDSIQVAEWTRREVRLRYEKLRSSINNFEDLMSRGARYALNRDEDVLYQEVRDLEFFLDIERDAYTGALRADKEKL